MVTWGKLLSNDNLFLAPKQNSEGHVSKDDRTVGGVVTQKLLTQDTGFYQQETGKILPW